MTKNFKPGNTVQTCHRCKCPNSTLICGCACHILVESLQKALDKAGVTLEEFFKNQKEINARRTTAERELYLRQMIVKSKIENWGFLTSPTTKEQVDMLVRIMKEEDYYGVFPLSPDDIAGYFFERVGPSKK